MISFLLSLLFHAGLILLGAYNSNRLKKWVRDGVGWARGRVFARAPAVNTLAAEVPFVASLSSPPMDEHPKNEGFARQNIPWGRALSNIASFFAGVFAWALKHPILTLGLILLALYMAFGLPFGFGKSRGELRLERDLARAETEIAQHETNVASRGTVLAERTLNDARRRDRIIEEAKEDIDDAVSQADFDALHNLYAERYRELWHDYSSAGEPDPPARRSDPVRSPRRNSA